MAGTSKADKSTGKNYDVKVSPALRDRLKEEFNKKYRSGKQILQAKFQIDWGDTSDHSLPTGETVRKFFSGKTGSG